MPTYVAAIDENFVPLDIGLHLPAPVFMSFQRDVAKKWSVRASINFFRDVVFQRKAMPWFTEEFQFPQPSWHALREKLPGGLSEPDVLSAPWEQSTLAI